MNQPAYNDIDAPYDPAIFERVRNHGASIYALDVGYYLMSLDPLGVDDLLSKHIAHLFIRDPLVIFSETIQQDDTTSNDHFEVRFFVLVASVPG